MSFWRSQHNVRIVGRMPGVPQEVYGSWYVSPEEYPNSTKMHYIRKQLAWLQYADTSGMTWTLETRGTHADWHPIEEEKPCTSAS